MALGKRVDAGIRKLFSLGECSTDQADKSGGHRDDSCKITLFDAPICWLRTIHRHTAAEAFHYPTNMSPMICQANSRRVPIDRKLGYNCPSVRISLSSEVTRAAYSHSCLSGPTSAKPSRGCVGLVWSVIARSRAS